MHRAAVTLVALILSGCFLYPKWLDLRIPPGLYRSDAGDDVIEVGGDFIRLDVHLHPPHEWKVGDRKFPYAIREDYVVQATKTGWGIGYESWTMIELVYEPPVLTLYELRSFRDDIGMERSQREHPVTFRLDPSP